METIDPDKLDKVIGGANGQVLGMIGSFLTQLGGMFGQQAPAGGPAGPAGAAPGAAPGGAAAAPSAAPARRPGST